MELHRIHGAKYPRISDDIGHICSFLYGLLERADSSSLSTNGRSCARLQILGPWVGRPRQEPQGRELPGPGLPLDQQQVQILINKLEENDGALTKSLFDLPWLFRSNDLVLLLQSLSWENRQISMSILIGLQSTVNSGIIEEEEEELWSVMMNRAYELVSVQDTL